MSRELIAMAVHEECSTFLDENETYALADAVLDVVEGILLSDEVVIMCGAAYCDSSDNEDCCVPDKDIRAALATAMKELRK